MKFTNFVLALCALMVAGCAGQNPVGAPTTRVEVAPEEVMKTGFLKDYSILQKGGEGEANLVYWNPTADFSGYHSVIIDPVTVWLGSGSDFNKVPPAERQELANAFYSAAVKKLAEDYKIVSSAGPGVMHLRIALTDAQASNPALDTISTYIPQARVLQTVVTLGADTAGFVGEASAEAEVRDSVTGTLLVAGVDRRAGTKSLGSGTVSSWGDARKAFEAWAAQFSGNLKKRQGR